MSQAGNLSGEIRYVFGVFWLSCACASSAYVFGVFWSSCACASSAYVFVCATRVRDVVRVVVVRVVRVCAYLCYVLEKRSK